MPENLVQGSLPEFFQEQVSMAIDHQHLHLSLDAEFYLVNLLTSFSDTERLYFQHCESAKTEQTFAVQLLEAAMAQPAKKFSMLKELGDLALYLSGFFADSLNRRLLTKDYYVKMGNMAYSSLSGLVAVERSGSLKSLFDEMSAKFCGLVDVVTEVAEATQLNNDQNILKLYEKWLVSGSESTQRLLTQKGIQTVINKPDFKH